MAKAIPGRIDVLNAATAVERPYKSDSAAELERRVEGHWDTPEELHKIYVELNFRTRRKAVELRFLIEARLKDFTQYFAWPTTEAGDGSGSIDPSVFNVGQGMLGFLGYRVGANGLTELKRRALLDYTFSNTLPLVDSAEYMAAWGNPSSAERLQKMANFLAANVRLARRNNRDSYALAIADWCADLNYLRKKYYIGRFSWRWPNTDN